MVRLQLFLLLAAAVSMMPQQAAAPAAGVSAASAVSVLGIGPFRIPVDGVTEVVVTGQGFSRQASNPTCRLSSYRYIIPWYASESGCRPRDGLVNAPSVSFDRPSPTGYTAPARVINATHLVCTPPAVSLEGVAVLSVSMDNATFSVPSSSDATVGPTCLECFALFSASVSRRPFFAEQTGGVIVSTDTSLAGATNLSVSATLQSSPAVELLSHVPLAGGTKAKLQFSLAALPPLVRATLTVTLHGAGTHDIVKTRHFERVPPAPNNRSSAVDHETGALLVDGRKHLVTGMCKHAHHAPHEHGVVYLGHLP